MSYLKVGGKIFKNIGTDSQWRQILKRVAISAAILAVGVGGLIGLSGLKKPPAEAEIQEQSLRVEVLNMTPRSIAVTITGFGQVQALNSVNLSAQVAGQVTAVHPRLEVGETISRGERLFEIDPRDYASAVAQSRAEVAQFTNAVMRLKTQAAIDEERLKTIERNRTLAKAEFDRIDDLFTRHKVGTHSGMDRAEQAYNATADQADQMAQAVTLYPIRIKEASASLAAAKARLARARANLDRCRVKAPFTGRLTLVSAEKGQYVSPGPVLATLTDDTILELQVPLDSRDVRRWIQFEDSGKPSSGAWFGNPRAVTCRIRWTEDKQGHGWQGKLHRVVAFDQKTRTVTVAIRIDTAAAQSEKGVLPLVEGMFCIAEIPGRELANAFQVPREAVSYKNTVYMAVDQRLKTVTVQVARVDGDFAYITSGLKSGDAVITTRLVDPLENTLLEVLTNDES